MKVNKVNQVVVIIDDVVEDDIKAFENKYELGEYVNDSFQKEGTALKLELYMKDNTTEVFFLAPVNDEATIVIKDNNFEYEEDPDCWVNLVFEYVDKEEVQAYRIYKDYSFKMIIERQ